MTVSAALRTHPRAMVGFFAIALTALTLWAFSDVFVSEASRACMHLYRAARTAADTARADATIPDLGAHNTPEARSCGSIRQTSRWF